MVCPHLPWVPSLVEEKRGCKDGQCLRWDLMLSKDAHRKCPPKNEDWLGAVERACAAVEGFVEGYGGIRCDLLGKEEVSLDYRAGWSSSYLYRRVG